MLTAGFRRVTVSQRELSTGGAQAQLSSDRLPLEDLGALPEQLPGETPVQNPEGDFADPVADAVDRLLSIYELKANIITLRTADKMAGAVLSLRI